MKLCLVFLFFFLIKNAYPDDFNKKIKDLGNVKVASKDQKDTTLASQYNYKFSPYTGYTRNHWLEITERIIAGVLPYYSEHNKRFELPYPDSQTAFKQLKNANSEPPYSRILERSMMAVIVYTKATGKDEVPGYEGSISSPYLDAIVAGTDPQSPYYWGDPGYGSQVGTVSSLAAYINPEVFWDPLSEVQKRHLLQYWQKHTHTDNPDNNHYYFRMPHVALLEQHDMDNNREYLTGMFDRLMGWYRGNGWFLDGSNQGFDYYNYWGFHLYNQILYRYDTIWRKQFGEMIEFTTKRFMPTCLFFTGRDGGPVPWGRSLSYRFANNTALIWAYLNENCTLPPGQVRRILSGTLKYFWDHGCLSDNGLLNIGFWGANASLAENYLFAGDPYWATHGLAALLIPASDPFWQDPELPVPADGPGGRLVVPGAQMLFRVSPLDGESRMYPVGQPFRHSRNLWQSGEKYDQHSYSSYLGFCITGMHGGDIGAGRTGYSYDGKDWLYRERAQIIQLQTDHVISTYKMKPLNEEDSKNSIFTADEITTHTLIGNDGEIHVFWHNHPEPLYLHLGGYGISIPHDQKLSEKRDADKILVTGGDFQTILQTLRTTKGMLFSKLLIPEKGWTHTHLFGGKGAYPYWRTNSPVPPNRPQILYVNGTRNRPANPVISNIEYFPGKLMIQFEGKWFSISVPY